MKRAINAFIVLAGVALCLYVIILGWTKNNGSNGFKPNSTLLRKNEEANHQKIMRVKVAIVRPQPITEYLLMPGIVEAWEDIDLSAKVGGTVEWLGPKEGDRVSSGKVILHLDAASRQALCNQARAQLAQAEKQYERLSKLAADGVGTRADLDNATTLRDVARANLKVAEVALNDATLRSPIDGVIDRIRVDVGEHVNSGEVVAKIVQTDRVKIVVNMPEKDVSYCTRGQPVGVFGNEVSWDQIPWDKIAQVVALMAGDKPSRVSEKIASLASQTTGTIAQISSYLTLGKIYYVALTAEPASRTYPVHVESDNRNGRLRPGMIVRVGLIRRQVKTALTAPLYAVVDRGDRKVLFVESNGKAVQREVVPGIIDRDKVEITRGLAEGDRLIVVGQRDLADGEPIEVEETVQP